MDDLATKRPRVLIEDWLPVAELGIESRRERAAVHALPPLSFLHIWWARRPLVASAAVVLAGMLPAWSELLRDTFPADRSLGSEREYRRWFMRLIGILGDPVTAQAAADAAKAAGVKSAKNPFTYKQAYRNSPDVEDVDLLQRVLAATWGPSPALMDVTAGGGSIPFAAARLRIRTYANDLNPVAASVLRAGVEIPSVFGVSLAPELRQWGEELVRRINADIAPLFPSMGEEKITNYLFVNTVKCPRTGRLVPLLPDKWLCKDKGREAAVQLVLQTDNGLELDEPVFEVVRGGQVDKSDADLGTIRRGKGVSPYDNLVIDGDYIKEEAQGGRMQAVLYAVIARDARGNRVYRAPSDADREALLAADRLLEERRPELEAVGLLPTASIPEGLKTAEPLRYGINKWADCFTSRQLLVHAAFARHFAAIADEVREAMPAERAAAVLVELAMMQGKALNYNSRLASWHVPKQTMRSVFERHDLAFKWTFAEMSGPDVYTWALSQVLKVYPAIAELVGGVETLQESLPPAAVAVSQSSAAHLPAIADSSIVHICMDPPYYDNVMYAELSDFFYVWERGTLGQLLPHFFSTALTDKENEAVANPARFQAMGRRKQELADLDYESKMTAIFSECRRIMRDEGVLSLMFTHKRAEAWDTLGMSLLQAGFTIETSWPVNTESEHSLHQANMNSAASTIMLVCRKRGTDSQGTKVFLDDIEADIRAAAREAVARFRGYGIDGVDLLLSTYGPSLSVISSHWPVYSAEAESDGRSRLLRPEEALAIAREEVVRLQRQRIVGREAQIDNHSDFTLIAWETFKAYEFSFDEARRLALAVGGLDMDDLARAKVIEKKSGSVRLLPPKERLRRGGDDSVGGVRVDATKFDHMNDALDTVLYIADVDGMSHAKAFMDRLGLTGDARFLAYVQGMVNAVPRVKVKGEWVVAEAGLLDTLVTAHLPDIVLPPEPDPVIEVEPEMTLFDE